MTSTAGRRILKQSEDFNAEEKRILDLLNRGLSQDFPNPQRVGCPDSAVLRDIALQKASLAEADCWLNHFGSCSPCFQEFTQFRKREANRRRRAQLWFGAAAVLLFAVGGSLWVHSRPPTQATAAVVLDLRERSIARGQNPSETGQTPLAIPRGAKRVVMDLPIGSKEGSYDVALMGDTGTEILNTAAGTARLENHVVVLQADVDFKNVRPGSYFLGLRQPGLEWEQFPVHVF
jgi:hypothetical protein